MAITLRVSVNDQHTKTWLAVAIKSQITFLCHLVGRSLWRDGEESSPLVVLPRPGCHASSITICFRFVFFYRVFFNRFNNTEMGPSPTKTK